MDCAFNDRDLRVKKDVSDLKLDHKRPRAGKARRIGSYQLDDIIAKHIRSKGAVFECSVLEE